ncbi:MAG: methyltransferase [Nostoc sp. DedVER02]|uniref:methyltransferase n=1 Tax=unclassified Nostoc TaxID=2593658 RepID=UPI002AD4F878|nr:MULTISPECIES: methyltransferase [unclassified Nostoc]MDZ7987698.1 methyltransferase [Nostoc sp. DedVER02]MDZ8113131.1 methyltransferase [Nostoc sp. DedVER01b]
MLSTAIVQTNIDNQKDGTPPSAILMQMLNGHYLTQAIYVAAKLGIADLLKDGAKSSDDLAKDIEVDAQSLYRLLRALTSHGIFAEIDNSYFELTSLAKYLQTDTPDSMRSVALLEGEDWLWQSWGNMFNAVKTGISGFEDKFGMNVREYFAQNPGVSNNFKAGLNRYSAIINNAVLEAYDFSSFSYLVDIGGGYKTLLPTVLKANSNISGILFDLLSAVERFKEEHNLQVKELLGRYKIVIGDFFESVPTGGNAYILKQMIHNWGDDRAIQILKNCYQAMPKDGKLLVIDPVVYSNSEPSFATFLDLQMLVTNSATSIRTIDEFENLFTKAGFQLTNIIPTKSPCSIIEGSKGGC